MRLKELGIKTFRGYRSETRIPIDPDVTGITGKNDTGKSSILEALDVFFEGGEVTLDRDDSWNCASGYWARGSPGAQPAAPAPARPAPVPTPAAPAPAPLPAVAPAAPPAVPVLKEKHIRIGYGDTGFTYESLFGDYLKGAKEITIEDPYT